jgi:hypothetical protein
VIRLFNLVVSIICGANAFSLLQDRSYWSCGVMLAVYFLYFWEKSESN